MMDKDKVLKFDKKNVGEMNREDFIKYYNNEWFPFMKKVSEYGEALSKISEMLGLPRHSSNVKGETK